MSEFLFEAPVDMSDLEIKRLRLHHWGSTPSSNAPSGKIGYNSGSTFHPQGLPEWSDGLVWHQIWPAHEPFVRNGFAVVRNDELTVDVFTGYLNGIATRAEGLEDPIGIILSGKVTGGGTIQNGGYTYTITTTALSVVPADITLASGKLISGGVGGTGLAINRADIRLNEWGQPNADIVFNGSTTISGIRDPVLSSEIATRGWVLGIVSGVAPKTPVRVATAEPLPAYDPPTGGAATVITASTNGALTIDGVVMVAGDRVLVKNESGGDQEWNGVYTVSNAGLADPGGAKYVLTRATDADSDSEVTTGDEYFVATGDDNGGTSWALQTLEPLTLGTTGLTFVQTSGGGEYTAGNGLVVVGRKFHFAQSENYTPNGVAYATGLTTMGLTADGSPGNVLIAGADSVPVFGQVNLESPDAVTGVLPVVNGGIGLATLTAGAILVGAGTSDVALVADVATGNVLRSGGVGANPSYGKVKIGSGTEAGVAGSDIEGILRVENGGIGLSSLGSREMLFGSGGSAMSKVAAPVQWQILQSAGGGGQTDPKFVTVAGDLTSAAEGSFIIGPNKVTFAKMDDLGPNCVIGADTGGDPKELQAVTNGHVLRRSANVLAFGPLDLAGDTFSGTTVLPTSRGGTGLNAPLEFVPHGGQVPHFRKITLQSGSNIYTVPHGYGNRHLIASVVRSDGRVIGASITIDDTNVVVVFGFVTTSTYKLMLCGHTATDSWVIPPP